MRFSENEMVFFNSITEGNTVFGIPLNFRTSGDRDGEVSRTIQGLMKKGILKSETELSELGVLPARALECYKKCQNYVIINRLHIGLWDNQEAVVIVQMEKKAYEMFRIPRAALLFFLIKSYDILCEAEKEVDGRLKNEDMDTFLKGLAHQDGMIMTGEFLDGNVGQEIFYYWKDGRIFKYDIRQEKKREVSAVTVRRELVRLLQVKEGKEAHG